MIPFARPFQVLREVGQGSYVDGFWIPGSSATFTAFGSVQNAMPNDTLALAEGNRTKETLKIYTDTALRLDDESNQKRADRVFIGGRRFKVVSSMNYTDTLGVSLGVNHNRYLLQNDNDETVVDLTRV